MAKAKPQELAALASLLAPQFTIIDGQYLSGGLSNRCMKLTDITGRHFVWRPDSSASQAFSVSRKAEFDAQFAAASCGIAAKPVALYAQGLLSPWLDGETVDNPSLALLVELLVKVHDVPALSKAFDPFESAQRYFDHLSKGAKSAALCAVHGHFQRHRFVSGLPLTTCHYDLGGYNLIQLADGSVKVIDWEYAALGDPALDIVMTSLANGGELETLVNHYCLTRRIPNVEQWQDMAKRWLPVATYLGALWYALGFELYGEALYRERRDSYLDQLLEEVEN